MTDRIIFLDIDGPMISGNQCLIEFASSMIRQFATYSVAAINRTCDKIDAKIVFNSYHNYQETVRFEGADVIPTGEDLRLAAMRNGIHEKHIHEHWRTQYSMPGNRLTRIEAINFWIHKHGPVEDWVVIDDANLSAVGDRFIEINFCRGFGAEEMNQIFERYGVKGDLFL